MGCEQSWAGLLWESLLPSWPGDFCPSPTHLQTQQPCPQRAKALQGTAPSSQGHSSRTWGISKHCTCRSPGSSAVLQLCSFSLLFSLNWLSSTDTSLQAWGAAHRIFQTNHGVPKDTRSCACPELPNIPWYKCHYTGISQKGFFFPFLVLLK